MPLDLLELRRVGELPGHGLPGGGAVAQEGGLGKLEATAFEPKGQARRILRELARALAAAAVPKRADRQHRGRAEHERDGRHRARGESALPGRLRRLPARAGGLEPCRSRERESRLERERRQLQRERDQRLPRPLPEPEHLRVEPHLVAAPAHGGASFVERPACPPLRERHGGGHHDRLTCAARTAWTCSGALCGKFVTIVG